jgi:hypothetical protein
MINLTVTAKIAPDGYGDNYYANEARLTSDADSVSLHRGPDWQYVVQRALSFAKVLNVPILFETNDGERIVAVDAVPEYHCVGREAFLAALAQVTE